MSKTAELVGRMFVVGFEGYTAPDYILTWLAEGHIGGVILFARNVESPAQLAALTQSLHQAAPRPILIGIDQEGGMVARMHEGFTEIPGAMALSNTDDEALTERAYGVLGLEMRALGINWDYAPVVDISYNKENPTVGTRSFGPRASRISRYASAAMRGLQGQGVAACAKHFPGLGDTAIDTHQALPSIHTPLNHLLEHDLEPYRVLTQSGLASIMTTHTIYATLDAHYPSTLSPHIVQRLLRDGLGYDGVVTSDCMEMLAIADHYTPEQRGELGALAGLDIILVSHTREAQEGAYAGLLAAVEAGRVPLARIEEANRRIATLLERFAITDAPDLTQIRRPESLATAYEAALSAIHLQRNQPLDEDVDTDRRILVVEFASSRDSLAQDDRDTTVLRELFIKQKSGVVYMRLSPDGDDKRLETAINYAFNTLMTIVFTRNAHMNPAQAEQLQELAAAAMNVMHVCLRNPYDSELLPDAHVVIQTFGDSQAQLQAVLDVIENPDLAPRRATTSQGKRKRLLPYQED